jgi:hypothetical protein
MAGMAVRIVDIDITGANRKVPPEQFRKIRDIDAHYGHAGPMFVRRFIERGEHRNASRHRETILEIARLMGGVTGDAAMIRAAQPFAILTQAGRIAQEFGLLPAGFNVLGAVKRAWDRFVQSSDTGALTPAAQAVDKLNQWISERWDSTIRYIDLTDEKSAVRDCVAFYDGSTVYIPKDRLVEAAGGALKETEVAAILKKANALTKTKSAAHSFTNYVTGVGRINAYALCRRQFGPTAKETSREEGGRFHG